MDKHDVSSQRADFAQEDVWHLPGLLRSLAVTHPATRHEIRSGTRKSNHSADVARETGFHS